MKNFINENTNLLNIKIGKEKVNEVVDFTYSQGIDEAEKTLKAQVERAFFKKKNVLLSNIGLGIRKKLLKLYVWIIAMNGRETWTIGKAERRKI